MSLVKLKKSKPFGDLVTSDFFGNGFRNQGILNDSYWIDRIVEPALNIKANEGKYEMALTTHGNTKKDIKITIDDGCLNISAKKAKSEKDKMAYQYLRQL